MADQTNIEWADATWNPLRAVTSDGKKGWHCEHVSEGCRNCYAETFNVKRLGTGLPFKPGHRGDVQHILDEKLLLAPLRRRKPTRYFLSSMTDVFGAWVPDEHLDRIFAVMALAPQHTFMVLTKRPERLREYLTHFLRMAQIGQAVDYTIRTAELWKRGPYERGMAALGKFRVSERWPLPNVWLGTSVEDQRAADERIPHLLATPAAVRFLSCEPLLGPVDLRWIAEPDEEKDGVIDALLGCNWIDGMGRGEAFHPVRPGHEGRQMTRYVCSSEADILANRKLHWVIAGGESGPGARDWPGLDDACRSLRDQCASAGVAFFQKQMAGVRKPLRPIPDDLLVREFPNAAR